MLLLAPITSTFILTLPQCFHSSKLISQKFVYEYENISSEILSGSIAVLISDVYEINRSVETQKPRVSADPQMKTCT